MSKKALSILIASHTACLLLGMGLLHFLVQTPNAPPLAQGREVPGLNRPSLPTTHNNVVGSAKSSEEQTRQQQAALVYDGNGSVIMSLDKLCLSIEPITGHFTLDPRFMELIGATANEREALSTLLEETKKTQQEFEEKSFRLVEQTDNTTLFVVENTPENAKQASAQFNSAISSILGEDRSALFMKASENFMANNILFTDNTKVFKVESLTPELAKLAAAPYRITASTLSSSFFEGQKIGASQLRIAEAQNFLSNGEGFFTADIPERFGHLLSRPGE